MAVVTVIVGDLIESRTKASRKELSRQLPLHIADVHRDYREEFVAPLVLTRGIDELSGVLKRPFMSYTICELLNERLYPSAFRFAVVTGILDVGVGSKDARKMDGPAFHKAADLMEQAKRDRLRYVFSVSGKKVASADPVLTELANLIQTIRERQSDRQRYLIKLYEELNNQSDVAKELGVTQQTVSDALRAAQWRELRRSKDAIVAFLKSCEPTRQ